MPKDVKEPLNSLPEVEITFDLGSWGWKAGWERNRALSVHRLEGEIKTIVEYKR
jgi:hypothetical protein